MSTSLLPSSKALELIKYPCKRPNSEPSLHPSSPTSHKSINPFPSIAVTLRLDIHILFLIHTTIYPLIPLVLRLSCLLPIVIVRILAFAPSNPVSDCLLRVPKFLNAVVVSFVRVIAVLLASLLSAFSLSFEFGQELFVV
ncbi:hypothetical protein BKA66DRAFT_454824 [Pyrenochaeta sp. MPI-SDFR-AT-0127]|nr:hypothetical protein BKA66DRAFT_454824 [Pyrenochaeta sp. MPI-SDFR-AT-0127]